MPRAENRKRPANQLGKSKQGAYQNKQSSNHASTELHNAQNKKQELLEKMKRQQQEMREKTE